MFDKPTRDQHDSDRDYHRALQEWGKRIASTPKASRPSRVVVAYQRRNLCGQPIAGDIIERWGLGYEIPVTRSQTYRRATTEAVNGGEWRYVAEKGYPREVYR